MRSNSIRPKASVVMTPHTPRGSRTREVHQAIGEEEGFLVQLVRRVAEELQVSSRVVDVGARGRRREATRTRSPRAPSRLTSSLQGAR
jgi:hypothetical protein